MLASNWIRSHLSEFDVIDAEELVSLREEVEAWFTDVCQIQTASKTSDGYGGQTEGLITKVGYEAVPCEVYGGVSHLPQELFSGVVDYKEMFTVTVPVGTDVEIGDHIHFTSRSLHIKVTVVIGPESHQLESRAVGVSLPALA